VSTTKLERAQKEAKIELGGNAFFKKHPDLAPLDANVDVLAGVILQRDLGPLDDLASWEKAYEIAGDRLASARIESVPVVTSEPEVWPYAFCRPVRNYRDVKSYPHLEFKALWNDKKGGVQSEKSRIFQSLVNAILDKENAKRGGSR
jgi:hypothetical protein